MKLLVFGDLHYYGGEENTFVSPRKLVKFALPMLDKLIETAELEKVDAVVNLGDIIQDTNNKEKDIESLEFMFGQLKRFKCPCYSILGNHDMKMMDSAQEVEKIMCYENSKYSLDIDGFHLVFLSTDVFPERGIDRGGSYKTQTLSEESVEWLKKDLENNTLPCILFTHFPLAEYDAIKDECMFLKNRAEVKAFINEDKNIKAVFSGHQHSPKVVEENGLTHYIVGSPTSCFTGDGVPMGIYRMIETDKDNIVISEHFIEL